MWPVRGFDGVHLDGWERGETDKGVPYFIHHDSEQTQWDHPLLIATMEEIMDSNNIKYAAYRTAMKIRTLQKFVKFHLVTLPTMISVFDQHGLRLDKNEAHMMCDELEGVLADIFHVTKRDQTSIADTELLSEIALNVLLNFFDRDRSGMVKVSSAKVALTILCSARLQEKYKYLFRQFADHNNCISRRKLTELLTDLAQIPEYLSEKPSFGISLVNAAVDSCFAIDSSRLGVTEEVFLDWLLRQPQTLVWISTLYRLATAETVNHDAKCSICKMTPIAGLRYQCLRCFHYDLCQHCFFTGQMSRGHKLNHPLQEYCHKSTSREGTKAIMKMIKNKLSKKTTSKSKQRYLPIANHSSPQGPSPNGTDAGTFPETPNSSQNDSPVPILEDGLVNLPIVMADGRALNQDQQRELESVIVNLEDENRLLLSEIEKLHSMSSNVLPPLASTSSEQRALMLARREALEDHNHQLELQLRRLRTLLQYLQRTPMRNDPSKAPDFHHLESTPSSQPCRANFNMLSPIDAARPAATTIVIGASSMEPQQRWGGDRSFGGQSGYVRRSLPLQHLSSSLSNNNGSFQHGQSFQRSSARAVLQSHEYSMSNRQNYDSNYTFHDISRDLLRSGNNNQSGQQPTTSYHPIMYGNADTTAKGLSKIQAELDDIIRQLENVYPGCSLPHPCHQQQQQALVHRSSSGDATRAVLAANEIGTMLAEFVGQIPQQNGTNVHHAAYHANAVSSSNGKAVQT